jgi:hypothetical protein
LGTAFAAFQQFSLKNKAAVDSDDFPAAERQGDLTAQLP